LYFRFGIVDITTVGNLELPLDPALTELGFSIVTSMKTLGVTINNRAENLEDVFDETIAKIGRLANKWSLFTVSLLGRIAISKTMLVSQVGYVGCIITPTDDQLERMQNIIDGFATTCVVVAKDRLYTKPHKGGLGLINLKSYCVALQCGWLKRCLTNVNDVWRWHLARSCDFNLDLIRSSSICPVNFPIMYNIAKSVGTLQICHWKQHENFRTAPLVDNMFFLRAEPRRREPVRGCVDRNLLGEDFYRTHRNELLALRMNCLLVGNRVVPLERLRQVSGLHFSDNVYMYLQTAANFALKKYGRNENSNGTSLTLTAIMDRLRKGSGKYRRMLEKESNEKFEMKNLRVVSTFFRLGNCEIPIQSDLELIHGLWSNSNLTIRIHTFAFQFFNNSVSLANRTAARYQNVEIDQRCVFCVKAKKVNPGREDFNHMFMLCPVLETPLALYFMQNFNVRYDTGN
jgi:hypothetical protein